MCVGIAARWKPHASCVATRTSGRAEAGGGGASESRTGMYVAGRMLRWHWRGWRYAAVRVDLCMQRIALVLCRTARAHPAHIPHAPLVWVAWLSGVGAGAGNLRSPVLA